MTYQQFLYEYFLICEEVPSYRLGQHFINCFIKDSSTPTLQRLWNESNYQVTSGMITVLIDVYQWDWNDLPTLPQRKYIVH